MSDGSEVEIARLQEQLKGIRDQQKNHADNTEKLFDKLFSEIDLLKAALNRGKGVFAATLCFAGLVGGAVTTAIEYMVRK